MTQSFEILSWLLLGAGVLGILVGLVVWVVDTWND